MNDRDWISRLCALMTQLDDEELADRIASAANMLTRVQIEHTMLIAEMSARTHARPGGLEHAWPDVVKDPPKN